MKDILSRLDKAFEHRMRLAIMSVLVVQDEVDFTSLKEMIDATDGNLASHLRFLEKYEYVTFEKLFVNRKPKTVYRASKLGKKAFKNHLKALEDLLKL